MEARAAAALGTDLRQWYVVRGSLEGVAVVTFVVEAWSAREVWAALVNTYDPAYRWQAIWGFQTRPLLEAPVLSGCRWAGQRTALLSDRVWKPYTPLSGLTRPCRSPEGREAKRGSRGLAWDVQENGNMMRQGCCCSPYRGPFRGHSRLGRRGWHSAVEGGRYMTVTYEAERDELVEAVRQLPPGTRFWFFGINYIYEGVPISVTNRQVRLAQPHIVYETGPLTTGPLKDAQALPEPFVVERHYVESWGRSKV